MLGPLGQVLFAGGLAEAIQWADQNLEDSDTSESDDDRFELDSSFSNLESADDAMDDFV